MDLTMMERVGDRWEKKMEGSCSTGQSPQWAVVPVEEEEEEEEEEEAVEMLNLGGLVNLVIIIQLPHKTNNFLIIKATISFPIITIHKITRHYHLRYKCELSLKCSLHMQLQKSQITQSRIAEGLPKHIHAIILVRSNEMASGNGAVYTSSHPTGTHITTPYTTMKKY
jgi:hypothetical protein